MTNTDKIFGAQELRQMQEESDRTKELREAASIVLDTEVTNYIRCHSYEIDLGNAPVERYELHATDILNACSSVSRIACVPTSLDEFSAVVTYIVQRLETLNYRVVIEKKAGNFAKIAISSKITTLGHVEQY